MDTLEIDPVVVVVVLTALFIGVCFLCLGVRNLFKLCLGK